MNTHAHQLSAFAAFTHLIIGLSELFRIGPRFLPPSWQVIYLILPDGFDWLYPGLWTLTGFVFVFGIHWPWALRAGFHLSSFLFLSWGVAGIPALMLGYGGNIQGATANIFIAGCAGVLAHYVMLGVKSDATNVQVARLAELVMPDHVEDQADEPVTADGQ